MVNIEVKRIQKGEIIPVSYDRMFTEIFNDEENIDVLESFLSTYLDIPLVNIKGKVKLLSRNIGIEHQSEGRAQVDLLFDFYGDKYNIELNNFYYRGKVNRNVAYASKIEGKELKRGIKDYREIPKTVQINFNNYRCNNKDVIETYYLRNEEGKILSESLKIEQIDMVLGSEICYTEERKEKIARWCKLLRARTIEELEGIIGEDLMEKDTKRKFLDKVVELTDIEREYAFYTDLSPEEIERNSIISEATENGIGIGRKEGLVQGEKKRNVEIAKKMLESNMDIEVISNITSLSKEEIHNLSCDTKKDS